MMPILGMLFYYLRMLSYDQFTSYIERGNYFEELVDEIRLVNEGEKNEE